MQWQHFINGIHYSNIRRFFDVGLSSMKYPTNMDGDRAASVVPLLDNNRSGNQEQEVVGDKAYWPYLREVIEEIKLLWAIAIPLIMTALVMYGKSAISVVFIGKLGKAALAGGYFAVGIANIFGYSLLSGLSSGTDPIFSQAYGAKQLSLMGLTLQRITLILLVICIPISVLLLNFRPIFAAWGSQPNISLIALTYLVLSIPDLVLQSIMNPLRIFLRSQNITLPVLLAAAFAVTLHAPINYLLVYHLTLGIKGIALSVAINDANVLAILFLYICYSGVCRGSSPRWSLDCFREWKPILKLVIPSAVSVCLEWWWYELMTILSGFLPNAQEAVATMGILIQATSLVYILPSSLSQAVSTRIGNELGANRPEKAKLSCLVGLGCSLVLGFLAMLFMSPMRHTWGCYFTDDEGILSMTAVVMPIAGLCERGNFPQTVGCGVLRGCARPRLGASINLGAFYGVGLPVGLYMCFGRGWGLPGLWVGLLAAQIVCALVMAVLVTRTDWNEQGDRAKEMTGEQRSEQAAI